MADSGDTRTTIDPLVNLSTGDGLGGSVVSECDVTDCLYNQDHQCVAGAIKVAFVDGMAHCATYSPRQEGETGGGLGTRGAGIGG